MPFKSKAQKAYLYIHHPEVAKEFAASTPANAELPEHVKESSSAPTPVRKRAAMEKMVSSEGSTK